MYYCTISGYILKTMKLWLFISIWNSIKTVELYYGFGMESYEKNSMALYQNYENFETMLNYSLLQG